MSAFTRLYDQLILALAQLAGAIVAATCVLVLLDVTLRALGVSIPAFAITFAEYAMLYTAMCAAPWLVRERGHVYIDLLVGALPLAFRRWMERVMYTATILACLIMTVTASEIFWDAVVSDRTDVRGIEVPLWISLLPLPVGFGLVMIEFLRIMLRNESYFDRGSQGRGAA